MKQRAQGLHLVRARGRSLEADESADQGVVGGVGRVALFAGQQYVELVLGGCDRRCKLNAHGFQTWRPNRDEQRLGRFVPGIQIREAALNQVGPRESFHIG